ncbi:hypothetical protein ESA_03782 [Cronobacter sakazakii ATCC BAA-894]|uniref:Uncharacterized protein n=1 Tax=Cronobacter sakazakii (strain ATCC BAA-894) TaxID=290339 RepID=A7MQH2_CROS8|nr:hypothetical protein ESA_03782 [Cronobacter sakazakii ATCC BAA-894]
MFVYRVVKSDGTDFRLQEGDVFASLVPQGCEPGQRKLSSLCPETA